MGGLAVLFLLGIYIVITVVLVTKVKGLPYKAVALLVMLLIPTADAIYGRYKLKQMCAAEGGLKVYRVAHGVDGFMGSGAADEYLVKHYGYKFSEGHGTTGKYYRVSMKNGEIAIEDNVNPLSKYQVRLATSDMSKIYWQQSYSIETFPSGEVLATDTQISFKGGWAERFLAAFSDAGVGSVANCNSNGLDPQKLVIAVLKS